MLRAVQLNLRAENDEILNSWMNWDNNNVYYVKNTQITMIDTEFRPKQRKNEIRFRHSVIASSEGRR